MTGVEHSFFYFGDIDKSGLSICHALNKKQHTKLAIPFKGKVNQQKDVEAITACRAELPGGRTIEKLLEEGFYYPQEILRSAELGSIWREWSWNFLNGKD
jgi:hypothetical protein